jgi:hypothetical protein
VLKNRRGHFSSFMFQHINDSGQTCCGFAVESAGCCPKVFQESASSSKWAWFEISAEMRLLGRKRRQSARQRKMKTQASDAIHSILGKIVERKQRAPRQRAWGIATRTDRRDRPSADTRVKKEAWHWMGSMKRYRFEVQVHSF